jgi:hypothetical protein
MADNPYAQPKKAMRTMTPEATPRATVAKGAVKTSGLAGAAGVLGGQHAGGNSDVAKAKAAESMLAKDIASGKVKDLNAERQMVAKKTGAWPNGATN